MYYSIQCNEETPFSSIESANTTSPGISPRLLEGMDQTQVYESCSAWVDGKPAPIENEAVVSDIPTLILSGEFDPITPPAWGQLVAETLTNSQCLEFPGYGHGVFGTNACDNQIVIDFLNDPNAPVDANCINSLEFNFTTE